MKTGHTGKRVGWLLRVLVLGILLFVVLYPFLWMVVTSFKAEADIVAFPPKLFSGHFGLQSYIDIWKRIPLYGLL